MKTVHLYKKLVLALLMVFAVTSFHSVPVVLGAGNDTVYDSYKTDSQEKDTESSQETKAASNTNQSLVPSILKFIFSFAAIIILLLLVLKFLKSKSKPFHSQGPFYAMSGYSLGNNRSLQLVMIGKTLYILGIGNDVQLLRTIEPGEEQDLLLQSLAEETERKQTVRLFSFKKKQSNQPSEDWEQILHSQIKKVKDSSFPINKLKD